MYSLYTYYSKSMNKNMIIKGYCHFHHTFKSASQFFRAAKMIIKAVKAKLWAGQVKMFRVRTEMEGECKNAARAPGAGILFH